MRWHSLVNLFMRPLLVRYGIPFYWISSGTNWDENIFRFIDFWVDQCLHLYSYVYDLINNKVLFTWTIFTICASIFFDSNQISISSIQSTYLAENWDPRWPVRISKHPKSPLPVPTCTVYPSPSGAMDLTGDSRRFTIVEHHYWPPLRSCCVVGPNLPKEKSQNIEWNSLESFVYARTHEKIYK